MMKISIPKEIVNINLASLKNQNSIITMLNDLNDNLKEQLKEKLVVNPKKNTATIIPINQLIAEKMHDLKPIEKQYFDRLNVNDLLEKIRNMKIDFYDDYFNDALTNLEKEENINYKELYLGEEDDELVNIDDSILIRPLQVNLSAFVKKNQIFKFNLTENDILYINDKEEYKCPNTYYVTPSGLENTKLYEIRMPFRKNIEGINDNIVQEITTFPNKYKEGANKDKVAKFIKRNNLTMQQFETIKKSYLSYIKQNGRLAKFQQRMQKMSVCNPVNYSLIYRITVARVTYYYIPDKEILSYLIDNMKNAKTNDRSIIYKICRVIKLQQYLQTYNNRAILSTMGLQQLFEYYPKKNILINRANFEDILRWSKLYREIKWTNPTFLLRQPRTNIRNDLLIPFLKEKKKLTCVYTFKNAKDLCFSVKQIEVPAMFPDVQVLASPVNTTTISINENNYRLMLLSIIFDISPSAFIRTIYVFPSINKVDIPLIRAYNAMSKTENGIQLIIRKKRYSEYKKYKDVIKSKESDLKKIKITLGKLYQNYMLTRVLHQLYSCSLYALVGKSSSSETVKYVLQDKYFQNNCKKFISTKLVILMYPQIKELLQRSFTLFLNEQKKNILTILQTRLDDKVDKQKKIADGVQKVSRLQMLTQSQEKIEKKINDLKANVIQVKPFDHVKNDSTIINSDLTELLDIHSSRIEAKYPLKATEFLVLLALYVLKRRTLMKSNLAVLLLSSLLLVSMPIIETDCSVPVKMQKFYDELSDDIQSKFSKNKIDKAYKEILRYFKGWIFTEKGVELANNKDG